jgi:hypothetical protein
MHQIKNFPGLYIKTSSRSQKENEEEIMRKTKSSTERVVRGRLNLTIPILAINGGTPSRNSFTFAAECSAA